MAAGVGNPGRLPLGAGLGDLSSLPMRISSIAEAVDVWRSAEDRGLPYLEHCKEFPARRNDASCFRTLAISAFSLW